MYRSLLQLTIPLRITAGVGYSWFRLLCCWLTAVVIEHSVEGGVVVKGEGVYGSKNQ